MPSLLRGTSKLTIEVYVCGEPSLSRRTLVSKKELYVLFVDLHSKQWSLELSNSACPSFEFWRWTPWILFYFYSNFNYLKVTWNLVHFWPLISQSLPNKMSQKNHFYTILQSSKLFFLRFQFKYCMIFYRILINS